MTPPKAPDSELDSLVDIESTVPATSPTAPNATGRSPALPSASGPALLSERLETLRLDSGMRGRSGGKLLLMWLLVLLFGVGAAVANDWGHLGPRLRPLLAARWASLSAMTPANTPTPNVIAPDNAVLDTEPSGLTTTGYIVARKVVHISARVPGVIVDLPVEEGDVVEHGGLIARLDNARFRADLMQAKAKVAETEAYYAQLSAGARQEEINRARAVLDASKSDAVLAQQEKKRAEGLRGVDPEADYERAMANFSRTQAVEQQASFALDLLKAGARSEELLAAKAAIAQAQGALAKAQVLYDATEIVAPERGTVLTRSVEIGQGVQAELGGPPICVLADLSQLEAEVDVAERELNKIGLEQTCEITTEAYADRVYRGVVRWISSSVNRQKGSVAVKIRIDNPDGFLLPQMNCTVVFQNTKPTTPAEPAPGATPETTAQSAR